MFTYAAASPGLWCPLQRLPHHLLLRCLAYKPSARSQAAQPALTGNNRAGHSNAVQNCR